MMNYIWIVPVRRFLRLIAIGKVEPPNLGPPWLWVKDFLWQLCKALFWMVVGSILGGPEVWKIEVTCTSLISRHSNRKYMGFFRNTSWNEVTHVVRDVYTTKTPHCCSLHCDTCKYFILHISYCKYEWIMVERKSIEIFSP